MIFIVILFVISIFILAATAIIIWPYRLQLDWVPPFIFVGLSAAFWLVCFALELLTVALEVKIFWAKVQYIGITTLPIAWFLFARQYLRKDRLFTRKRVLSLLGIIPAVTVLLVFTNESHNLIWQTIEVVYGEPFTLLDVSYGTWFWVHTAYSYFFIMAGTISFILAIRTFSAPYSYHLILLVAGAIIPFIGNVIYLTGLSPQPGLDLTPQSFGISVLLILYGVYRLDLFDIVPIGRNLALESAPDGMLIIDERHRILDANAKMLALFGRSRKELLGKPLIDLIKINTFLFAKYENVIEVDEDVELEIDGQSRYFRVRMSPMYNERRQLRGRLILLRDITPRKTAEIKLAEQNLVLQSLNRNLQQSESRLRQATKSGNIGTWEWSLKNQELTWSQGMENVFYGAPSDFAFDFDAYQTYTHPEDWPLVVQAFRDVVVEGIDFQIEHRISRRDGDIQWVSIEGQAVRNGIGDVEKLNGVIRDITDQKTGEQKLQKSNKELNRRLHELEQLNRITQEVAITTALNDLLQNVTRLITDLFTNERTVIFLLDDSQRFMQVASDYLGPEQRFNEANITVSLDNFPQTTNILKLNAPRIVTLEECKQGAAICTFLKIEDATNLMTVPLRSQDEMLGIIFMVSTRHGGFTKQEARLAETVAGQIAGAIRSAQLFRRTEHAWQTAVAANEAKSRFLAKVSHELRTPLGAVLGYSEMLQEGIYGPVTEKQEQTLEKIIDSSHFLTRQVSELVDLSQLESGRLQLSQEFFSLQGILNRIAVQFDVLAERKGLAFRVESGNLPPEVWGDSHRIQQIFVNLIGNAIKFTQEGSVTVTAVYTKQDQLCVQVADTGPGIPPEMQDKIFEAFQQVEDSLTRQQSGNGLGLSIVKELTTLMGGNITLESKVGVGSIFNLTLPLPQRSNKEDEKQSSTSRL